MLPFIRAPIVETRAQSDEGEATNGGVINTLALGSTGSAQASSNRSHATGVGSAINTQAVSGLATLPQVATSTSYNNLFPSTNIETNLGPMRASAVGGSASSGGHSTTTAVAAQSAHMYNHCIFTDRKEEKATALATLSPELSEALIKKLKSYYARKSTLPGLLNEHEQPIADINLSIRDAPSQTPRLQEEKESKTPKLEATDLEHFEKMHAVSHPVPVAEMFDKAPGKDGKLENKPAKHLLVTGAPGVGKTTMSQYVAYQWSLGKLWANKFDYLFWIPLRNLLQHPIDAKAEISLANVIHTECFDKHRTILVAAIDRILLHQASRTLLVLDGYDEIAHLLEDRHHPIARVVRAACETEYCIVTSRPYQLPSSDVFQIDRRLENTGFTDSNIKSYVARYFGRFIPPQPEKAQALLTYLKNNLSIWGSAHIPINLVLICEIWATETFVSNVAEGKEEAKPAARTPFNPELSLTGLYQKMALFLLERYLKREGKERGNRPVSWVYQECEREQQFLSQLSFEGLCEHETILTPELQNRLAAKFPSGTYSLFDKILASGFLRAADSPVKKEIDRPHYFIHLTFQEYLAAYYLVNCLKQDSRSEGYVKASEWLCREKYNPRYQVVLGFMSGLLSLDKTTGTALQRFWTVLLSEPFDLTGIGHIRLMIRCLEESRNDSRIPEHSRLLEEVGKWVWISGNGYKDIQNWVIPNLRASPWVVRQPSTLAYLLAYDEKAGTSTKEKIISILGRLGSVAAIPQSISVLLRALAYENKDIRNSINKALGQLDSAPEIQQVVEVLLDGLCDEDKQYVVEALGELSSVDDVYWVIEDMPAELHRQETEIRGAAAYVLGGLGSAVAKVGVLEALLAALRNEDSWVRSNAVYALGKLGAHAEITKIINALMAVALCDEDKWVMKSAVYTLGQLGAHAEIFTVITTLLAALCDGEDRRDKFNAAAILSELDSSAATPEVIGALLIASDDKNDRVRHGAVMALGQLGSAAVRPDVITALMKSLRDEDFFVRSYAVKALGQLGPAAAKLDVITALTEALCDKHSFVRSNAAKALGQLGSVAARPNVMIALIEALRDEKCGVRSSAAYALGQLGPAIGMSQVIEALLTTIYDKDESASSRASDALGKLGSAAATPQVIESLLTVLRDENDFVRCRAVEALGKLGSAAAIPQVIEALLTALRDEDDFVRCMAVEALGKLGSVAAMPQVIESLLTVLRDENDFVRCSVVEALGKLGIHAETLAVINTLLAMLQVEKAFIINAIQGTLNQLNTSQYLYNLDVNLLKIAVTKKAYFSTTPLNAFILTWLNAKQKSLAVSVDAVLTEHTIWLEIVAALAFYRAIPVTLSETTIHVYEGSTTTTLPLPVEYSPLLREELIAAFATQAQEFGLPDKLYVALQKGLPPYPFEPMLPAPESVPDAVSATALSTASTTSTATPETKAFRRAPAAVRTSIAAAVPAKLASMVTQSGVGVFGIPAMTRLNIPGAARSATHEEPGQASLFADTSRKRHNTQVTNNHSGTTEQSSSSVIKRTKQ